MIAALEESEEEEMACWEGRRVVLRREDGFFKNAGSAQNIPNMWLHHLSRSAATTF